MKLKVVRIIAYVVIVCCIFVTGVSMGVIIQSTGVIAENIQGIPETVNSADFLIDYGRDQSQKSSSQDAEVDELFSTFWQAWDMLHFY